MSEGEPDKCVVKSHGLGPYDMLRYFTPVGHGGTAQASRKQGQSQMTVEMPSDYDIAQSIHGYAGCLRRLCSRRLGIGMSVQSIPAANLLQNGAVKQNNPSHLGQGNNFCCTAVCTLETATLDAL